MFDISKLSSIMSGKNPQYIDFVLEQITDPVAGEPIFGKFWEKFRAKYKGKGEPGDAFKVLKDMRKMLDGNR